MFSKLNDCVFIHTKQIIKNRIVALLDVRFPRVPSLYVVLRLLEALFPDPKLCCNTHPPSRSNCTLFCLGVQFIPRDLLHIPNSRKIFNVPNESHFRRKISVIIVPNFETGVDHCVPCDMILFYHSKRCGKLTTCGPRASSLV